MFRRLCLAATLAEALLLAPPAAAGALTDFASLPVPMRQQVTGMYVKGQGTNTWYALEVDPTTGNLPFAYGGDQNYGLVGVNTLRTAAQIGNATGAADFGQGAVSAQTLRTVSVLSNGSADLATGAGATGATVLRVVLPTDQTAIPAAQNGTWTVEPGNTANTTPWLMTVNQGGHSAVVTLGGALTVDGSAVTQPVSGTMTANAGTGTFAVSAASLPLPAGAATAANQTTGNSTLSAISGQLPATLGAKATAASLAVTVASDQVVPVSGTFWQATQPVSIAAAPLAPTGRTSSLVYRNNDSSVNITTSAYVQVVASTAGAINRLYVFDSSGSALIVATGAAASEVDKLYIPPGGSGVPYEINIPAGTRVAVKALDVNATSGQLIMTGLN